MTDIADPSAPDRAKIIPSAKPVVITTNFVFIVFSPFQFLLSSYRAKDMPAFGAL
jgi:hypothetical protein